MNRVLIYFILLLSIIAKGEPQFRDKLSRQEWKNEITESLTKKICEPKSYFVTCYSVTSGRCRAELPKLTKACFPQRLPSSIDLHNEGIFYGATLGRCVGQKYDELFHEKYKAIAECRNYQK
ncbi:MAG: hypothetical protein AABY64_14250 [Bdellovibrionota bacterium]